MKHRSITNLTSSHLVIPTPRSPLSYPLPDLSSILQVPNITQTVSPRLFSSFSPHSCPPHVASHDDRVDRRSSKLLCYVATHLCSSADRLGDLRWLYDVEFVGGEAGSKHEQRAGRSLDCSLVGRTLRHFMRAAQGVRVRTGGFWFVICAFCVVSCVMLDTRFVRGRGIRSESCSRDIEDLPIRQIQTSS